MSDQHGRDMSILVGTSKTLERAVAGLQMSSQRLMESLQLAQAGQKPSAGLTALITAIQDLNPQERLLVDRLLSGKEKPSRARAKKK